jgi:muramoyltetrapeptide carboxypeptidase
MFNLRQGIANRRQFFQLLGLSLLASQLPAAATNQSLPDSIPDHILKPPKLKVGDTVGLINPASPVDLEDVQYTEKALAKLGLNVKRGAHILDEYGYLAGKDRDRAADIQAMFADDSVKALLTLRGGWGCNRILPLLDYNLIRQNPKIIMGYSDITSLLLAIYARSGMVTFHGPVGTSEWNQFSLGYFQRILFNGGTVKMVNPVRISGEAIAPGKATGRIVGGNLSVLTSMVGSPNVNSAKNRGHPRPNCWVYFCSMSQLYPWGRRRSLPDFTPSFVRYHQTVRDSSLVWVGDRSSSR